MIRVGTCSWAADSFVKAFYPTGVDRLRYYAERFDVVEANSTYYRMPDDALVAQWADKFPDGFVMHVKAFGLMTRHPVKVGVLPEDLRAEVSVDDRDRVDRPPTGSTAERFDYLYSETELRDWASTLRELADEGAENVYAMFNNNGRSPAADAPRHVLGEHAGEHAAQAPTNAATLKRLLERD